MSEIAAPLIAAGLSDVAVRSKEQLYERCLRVFGARAPQTAERYGYFVPGRIELLGKHTDYAGGRSLLCAIERGFIVLALPRADTVVQVTDALSGEVCVMRLDTYLDVAVGDWSNYAATVVRRIARNFPQARRGADIVFASDLPPASGMSSSSALIIAIFLALSAVNALTRDAGYRAEIDSNEALAAYLAAVENGQGFGTLAGDRGVGTQGGSEDHTAILCCRAGFLSQYSFCPVRHERGIAFPDGCTLFVASSGVTAQKTGTALASYNEAASTAQRVLEIWNQSTGKADLSLADALASEPGALERLRKEIRAGVQSNDWALGRRLIDRLDQFALESIELVPRAGDALVASQLGVFGALVDRSQLAAEKLLRNQVPETITLVRLARSAGALAASAFGAGFGGSVWALVASEDVQRFARDWEYGYARAHPEPAQRAEFIQTRPGPAVIELTPDHA